MAANKSKMSVYTISAIGVMTAVSFISNFFSIPLGTLTRIHLGNVFCGLSGILLGPVAGGVAGGLGAFFYDFFNPLYVAEAPITLFNKFFIGFLAGLIAHKGGHYVEKFSLNLTGAIAGNLAYTLLFYGKNFISEYFLLRLEMGTIWANMLVRLSGSVVQIPLTLIGTMILAPIFLKAMQKSGVHKKLFPGNYGGTAAAGAR